MGDGGGELAVFGERAGRVGSSVLVDDHDHAVLAVLALGAVQPHGVGVVDHDGVDGHLAHGGAGGKGNIAGVDAGDVLDEVVDGRARVVEGGLGDGVVAAHELELDGIADGGLDVVGLEGGAVLANDDADRPDLAATTAGATTSSAAGTGAVATLSLNTDDGGQSRKRNGGELHFEWGKI